MREGEGVAAGVLESLGANLDKIRTETIRVLSQNPEQAGVSTSTGQSIPRSATKTPTLDQLGVDLTAAANSGKLVPIAIIVKPIINSEIFSNIAIFSAYITAYLDPKISASKPVIKKILTIRLL